MSQQPARIKLPDVTPPKAIHPGSNSWAEQIQTNAPTATNRDKYEDKPMPPTPEASPSPAAKPMTARKYRPQIQPATPLISPDHMNPNMKNRAVTDPVMPKPLFMSKTSTANQLRKKYSQSRSKSKSTKDDEDVADRHPSPPLILSQKASQILGVFPTKDNNRETAPASAPLSTRTSDPFRTSWESTNGRNASPNRQVQSTPILTRRYLQENHLPTVAVTRTSQELKEVPATSTTDMNSHQTLEGPSAGNESLNPTRLGTYGRTGEVGYVNQNEMHRVVSFSGVIEDANTPGNHEGLRAISSTTTNWNENTLRPQYSEEVLQPTVYSPNKYAGVWENDPNVGYSLPPFSPFYPRQPPLPPPPPEVDQRSFSQTSGDVPIVLQKFPGESSHGSGYTNSLRSQNSWALSGNGNSFVHGSTASSAAEITPRFPAHARNNSVPAPPMSYPGFQPSAGSLPPGLMHMELNLHHHLESCFDSLMRFTTDNADRMMDKMVRRAEESQEAIERGLKVLRSEIKDISRELNSIQEEVAGAALADDRLKDSVGSLGKRLNELDEKVSGIGSQVQRTAVEATEGEKGEIWTESQGTRSSGRRSRSTHASASSHQEHRQPYTSGTTSGSASTQHSVNSSRGRHSNETSSGAGVKRNDERSGRKSVSGSAPDIRDHPAYRGVAESQGLSSPIYQAPNYGAIWYQQAHGPRP
ncbi:MAG: hypothetical protein Q9182_004060 [Xanthomendoza sp. 2 TL-2023]